VIRARAWMTDGVLAFYQSDYAASSASLVRARADFAHAGDCIGVAVIDVRLARIDMYSDRALRAIATIERCLPVFQGGDDWAHGYALVTLGEAYGRTGDVVAMGDAYESARAIFCAIGNTWGEAAALNGIAGVALYHEQYADARRLYEQSLALNRELGDVGEVSKVLTNIAECARGLADWPSAIGLCEEALTMRRRIGAKFGMAMLTHNLGHAYMGKGDLTRAMTLFQDALRMGTGRGDVASLTAYIAGVASAMARRAQQPVLAATLCAIVMRERAADVGPFDGADRAVFERTIALLQQQLSAADYAAAVAAAEIMPIDEARNRALAVPAQPSIDSAAAHRPPR
jgi:Tetratricopeptide repeat